VSTQPDRTGLLIGAKEHSLKIATDQLVRDRFGVYVLPGRIKSPAGGIPQMWRRNGSASAVSVRPSYLDDGNQAAGFTVMAAA
jgi:hypothetical protein